MGSSHVGFFDANGDFGKGDTHDYLTDIPSALVSDECRVVWRWLFVLLLLENVVNSGTNYVGTTVYLDSDIDFTDELSEHFEVIGKDESNYFRGTFDSQGHVVRNLAINASSSYRYVGLFGCSAGTTIQNVVIDETCSFVSNYVSNEDYYACTGSIIGICGANDGPCTLENNVNMADVTFNGNTSNSFTGGIVGGLYVSNNYRATIKNCANYGAVSKTGTSGNGAAIGSIIDSSMISSSTSFNAYVQNCVNHGTVFYNGSSDDINIGGISGYSKYSNIENCVSSGPIVVGSSIIEAKFLGAIVGYVADSSTTITHCYWTLDVGCNNISENSDDSVTVTETSYIERPNTTTLDELNAYVTSHKLDGFSQWVMLRLNGGSVSNLNQNDLVVAQEHFPSPVKEDNTFLRWCKDLECGEVYNYNLTGVTALYAVWETVRVTFTFWNGTTGGPVCVEYGTAYGALPEAGTVVEGHTLRWFISNDDERVVTPDTIVTITSDHTLHGRWVANNYTVTLDLGNGTVITRTLQYNKTIELPQGITREGCTYTGWDNSNITNMPAKNITINALWDCTHNSHSSSSGDKSKSSFNTGAIVGGVVGGLVAIILIVLAVLILLMFLMKKEGTTKRRRKDRIEMKGMNSRVVEKSLNASEAGCCDDNSSSTLSESLSKVYPVPYRVPTIAEALYVAGISENKINTVVELCMNAGKHAAKEGKLTDTFGKEDAAAVALYTFDFGKSGYKNNPYRIINRALVSRSNEKDLKKASGLLYLVLSALRKLPRYTGGKLYRGIRGGVDVTSYKEGSTVVWHGLSSTPPDMKATKAFLENSAANEDDTVKGTLFIISNGWGYDIQPYSLFPDETEILLEPERRFRVQSVIEAELVVTNLEMVDTPVILPEIFGENNW